MPYKMRDRLTGYHVGGKYETEQEVWAAIDGVIRAHFDQGGADVTRDAYLEPVQVLP